MEWGYHIKVISRVSHGRRIINIGLTTFAVSLGHLRVLLGLKLYSPLVVSIFEELKSDCLISEWVTICYVTKWVFPMARVAMFWRMSTYNFRRFGFSLPIIAVSKEVTKKLRVSIIRVFAGEGLNTKTKSHKFSL